MELTPHGCSGLGVEFADHVVSRLADNCAKDSSNVAGNKGNPKLLVLGALRFGLGYNILVESLHGVLKACKLHHGVGDLATPQRLQPFVQPVKTHISFKPPSQPCCLCQAFAMESQVTLLEQV